MKISKKLIAVFLVAVMMIPMNIISNGQSSNIINKCENLTVEQTDEISNNIQAYLLNKYNGIYKFDNFEVEFFNEQAVDGKICIDVDATVDMTLIQAPKDSPYVLGMEKELLNIKDESEKQVAQKEIDSYLSEVEQYYNIPYRSTFPFRIELELSKNTMATERNAFKYDFLHRMDITDEEVLTSPVSSLEQKDETQLEINGANAITELLNQETLFKTMASSKSFVYDRLAARDYAKEHATDEPEFNKADGSGSDCANFVSKALNAGGIPEDKTGKWYQSTKYGNVGYAGTNWIRTGYNNNGGVVPYMTGKNYFYYQSNESKVFAGSIMYWTSSSHVALTTYGDGQTIKYSQHSNVKKTKKEYTYDASSISVKFYMPSTSIMNE